MSVPHDPLDSLNHVEASFYQQGYAGGFAHGALHGLFEGRALGKDKAFELWEEVGYYEGVAGLWKRALARPDAAASTKGQRAAAHLDTLIGLIALFPVQNSSSSTATTTPPLPSAGPEGEPADTDAADAGPQLDAHGKETDIAALLERIRGRYKLVCSALGVRPRLSQAQAIADDANDGPTSGVDSPAALDKGQVVVNGQQISSKQLLF